MSKCKHFISVRFLDEGNNNEKLTCNSVNHTVVTHVITGETEEEFVWNVVDFIEEFVQVKSDEIEELIVNAKYKPCFYDMIKVYNNFVRNETFVKLVMQKTNMKAVVEELLVNPWEPKENSILFTQRVSFVIQQNMKNRLFPLIEALQYMKVEK
jgi:uncharacterized protein YuzB (UPF0349 family)